MQKFKILVDCHVFDGNFQGTTTYLKGLYTELLKHKNIHFFFASCDIAGLKNIFGEQQNLTYVKYKSHNKFYRLLFDIPRIISKNRIDFAHFQYVVPPLKKCKYIVTMHDVLFLDFPKYFPLMYRIKNKFLFQNSAKISDIVLSVSEYSKTQIEKHFGLKNVTVTPNAVDPIFYESYDKKDIQERVKRKFGVSNYFLFVSRWEPRKNHHNLLKVFVENEYYKNYTLVFIGDKAIQNKAYDDYYQSLPKTVKETIVTFNKVDFDDLLLFVRAAALSIYPSIAEGFGIPPLESLAAGVPSTCSNTTAMSDFSFFNSLQFNPLSPEDIHNKIKLALSDVELWQRRETMQAKYNWEKSAHEFLKQVTKSGF
jgi:glycosyltransferase involved in cell wall biosynthesis